MLVLALETGSAQGSVALLEDGRVLAEEALGDRLDQERNLVPALESLVRDRGFEPAALGLVAAGTGPGSFTGLRIGLACAKTLALALGKDLVGVPTFDALPANVPASAERCAPVLDARRGRVFGAWFFREGGSWVRETEDLWLAPGELADRIPKGALVFGSGAAAYPDAFRSAGHALGNPAWAIARASEIGRLGIARHAAGMRADPRTLEPVYLCRLAVEEKLAGGA